MVGGWKQVHTHAQQSFLGTSHKDLKHSLSEESIAKEKIRGKKKGGRGEQKGEK